jgi:hypothetical protein
MPQLHETQMGQRFFTGHFPALVEALRGMGSKQMACCIIAAGFHAGNENTTADHAAKQALKTFEAIEKGLKE